MKNPTLSPFAIFGAVAVTASLACVIEAGALQAKERQEMKPRRLDRAYCTRCHSDEHSILMMQLKEGSCTFLFSKAEKRGAAQRLAAYSRAHPRSFSGYGGTQSTANRSVHIGGKW